MHTKIKVPKMAITELAISADFNDVAHDKLSHLGVLYLFSRF